MPASLHAGRKIAPKTPENGKRIAGGNYRLFPAALHVDNTLDHSPQAATVEYCERLSMNSWTPVRCCAAPPSMPRKTWFASDAFNMRSVGLKAWQMIARGNAPG
jgi:hypothetical protein